MEFLEFDAGEYNRLLAWFTLAYGKKNNAKKEDLELCEKLRVLARQYIRDFEENKKEE